MRQAYNMDGENINTVTTKDPYITETRTPMDPARMYPEKLRKKITEKDIVEYPAKNYNRLTVEDNQMEKMLSHRDSGLRWAAVRTSETADCPLGLPIPQGCSHAGESALDMKKDDKERNTALYNKKRTHSRCPYANQLNVEKDFVNCSFGDTAAGLGEFEMTSGSAIYPRLWEGFNTINLDRQYHQYKDFSYFSLYGSHTITRILKA